MRSRDAHCMKPVVIVTGTFTDENDVASAADISLERFRTGNRFATVRLARINL